MNGYSVPSDGYCPEFFPTREQFASFSEYIRTEIEPNCLKYGICKVVPPRGWFSRSYEKLDFTISRPVSQHVAGKKGIFHVDLLEKKSMRLEDFKRLSEELGQNEPNAYENLDEIERVFWKSLRPTMDPPVYGADVVGSLFGDDKASSWNLSQLDSILKRIDLPGITRPMLYFGMWRAMFALHTEDMDLFSINYLHTGKPKFWYGVPPDAAPQLERAAQTMFPEKFHSCSQFLRHKTSMISPTRLREFGVPYHKAIQKSGEFVITFPGSYHGGFNLGFNIAEAVNFATLRWIPYGLNAKVCKCTHDSVRIDMDNFMTKVFNSSQPSSHLLGADTWIFSCKCRKYCSSADSNFYVEERWFECSRCNIWQHLRCIHPSMLSLQDKELPSSILCHRCMKDTDNKQSKSEACKLDVPLKRKKLEDDKRVIALKREKLLVKGSLFRLDGHEAKVTAVDGKFVRVHYKGQSNINDEWVSINSKKFLEKVDDISLPFTKNR